MHVCFLQTVLDPYKGGSHLPLLRACTNVRFTILCNRSKVRASDLPPNVTVVEVPGRIGSYYYGIADYLFGGLVMRRYPIGDAFWKQFSVVHLNHVVGPAVRALCAADIPVLSFVHHPVTADRDVAVQESRLLGACRWRMKYAFLCSWQRRMCLASQKVATVSETVRSRLHMEYGVPIDHITVVPNGVDSTHYAPSFASERYDVVAIGSFMHPRKGFRYLADAYRLLAQARYRIADVGRRSPEQSAVLASIRGVQELGTVTESELLSTLQHSSALISTSLYEGFGLSVVEALACGRPAFAFDGGAIPEILGGIDPSLCVPCRDTAALVEQVVSFLRLPQAERHARGEHYRNAVMRRYSLQASADALQNVYREMCH